MSADGATLIAAERLRQITEEGYTAERDAGIASDLIEAAISYAQCGRTGDDNTPASWPWLGRYWKPSGDRRRDLVKAGALIAAAIDALVATGGES
jgi:hypothetical protein